MFVSNFVEQERNIGLTLSRLVVELQRLSVPPLEGCSHCQVQLSASQLGPPAPPLPISIQSRSS